MSEKMPQVALITPDDFVLKQGQIGITVGARDYGLLCPCGGVEFSEDDDLRALACSTCGGIIAIRADIEGGLQ